ncbi:MAG: PD-(D/E)XK nuclease family protein [Rubripirellula sp.]
MHSIRRMQSLLRWDAAAHDLQYDPPEIITVGQLPEQLYRPNLPAALEFEQTLAWARILRSMHPEDLEPLIPTIPAPEPVGPWLELAGTLRRLHEELSANRLTFSDVIEVAETDSEKRRWKLLNRLFEDYLGGLADAGLADPHWSRRLAIHQDRCSTEKTIVLIGTSDLSESVVGMLRSLDSDLISLVAAPSSQHDRFDEFGCVDTDGWINHQLPIRDEHLIGAGDIADQATSIAECLAEFGDAYSADQVTVGVTDESHVGPIELELQGCGVSTYRHLGWTIPQTAIGRLLNLTATYLQRRTWQSLAALVRHADVYEFVSRGLAEANPELQDADWLSNLDQLLANHFPIRVAELLPAKALDQCGTAKLVSDLIESWLSVFSGPDQTIAKWSVAIDQWLQALYADRCDQSDPAQQDRTTMALETVRRVIGRFYDLNDRLDLSISGGAAVEMMLGRLSDVRVVGSAKADDVEILGWLDLALDDAPAMAVIGLNHPFVPGSVTSDPFLPGSLRTRLRMSDNDRRYARDVYAMQLLLSTRTAIRFVVGRRGADQSPTPPSRLLAATPPSDAARRVRNLLGGRRDPIIVHHRWDDGPDRGLLPIPEFVSAEGSDAVKTMSVTAFRDYLACPYRFYLRHVLKLKPLDDSQGELAANQFGDLVHGSLERFGESADKNESDRSRIEAALLQYLHEYASEFYGDAASTAVTLQVAQAERRLKAVARQQAARIAAGWTIYASEASVNERDGAGVKIDGKQMGLRGRFDRIDFHQPSGRWAILDYKTHGHKPEKKHLQKTDDGSKWIDLQLPLYRMMIPFLGIDADPIDVQLGYFNVSEKDEETKINIAEFPEPLMRQAEELIHDCIRRIWAGDFQPTNDRVQFDDYGMILQTGVASRLLDQAEMMMGEEAEA